MTWQPIETAPADGTIFLGWIGVPWLFCWHEKETEEVVGRWPWSRKTVVKKFTGWHGVVPHGDKYALMWIRFAKYNQPTHWMPLPEPPTQPKQNGE